MDKDFDVSDLVSCIKCHEQLVYSGLPGLEELGYCPNSSCTRFKLYTLGDLEEI